MKFRKWLENLGILPVTVEMTSNIPEGNRIVQKKQTYTAQEWQIILLAEQNQILGRIENNMRGQNNGNSN